MRKYSTFAFITQFILCILIAYLLFSGLLSLINGISYRQGLNHGLHGVLWLVYLGIACCRFADMLKYNDKVNKANARWRERAKKIEELLDKDISLFSSTTNRKSAQ